MYGCDDVFADLFASALVQELRYALLSFHALRYLTAKSDDSHPQQGESHHFQRFYDSVNNQASLTPMDTSSWSPLTRVRAVDRSTQA